MSAVPPLIGITRKKPMAFVHTILLSRRFVKSTSRRSIVFMVFRICCRNASALRNPRPAMNARSGAR